MEQQAPQRTAISGPTLVRLLARLAQREASEPSQSLSDRLAEWLGWADAITLSSALNGAAAAASGAAVRSAAPAASAASAASAGEPGDAGDDAQAWCTRSRASLVQAIAAATQGAPSTRARAGSAPAGPPPDYADLRQRYLSAQQTMESEIAELRQRLRSKLAACGVSGRARLASVDAVMERALGARERSLLATVPTLLGARFERLREAAQASADDGDGEVPAAAASNPAWLRTFRRDMQAVLLAELEVRFQPVEGLLAALRNR